MRARRPASSLNSADAAGEHTTPSHVLHTCCNLLARRRADAAGLALPVWQRTPRPRASGREAAGSLTSGAWREPSRSRARNPGAQLSAVWRRACAAGWSDSTIEVAG